MPVPPKQDPSRPLHLAVRSMRMLGLIGFLFGVATLIGVVADHNPSRKNATMQLAVGLSMAAIVLGFGVIFLIFAVAVRRQRLWAIYATMAITGLALGWVAISLLGTMVGITHGSGNYFFYGTLVIQLLFAAAFTQLMYHLTRARAFVVTQVDMIHGFSPIMPAQPIERNDR